MQRQSIGRNRYELFFVDSGSTDGTTALIHDGPGVTLMREDRPGSYAARNAAIARARGEFFAFTDADCVAEPYWLKQAQEAMHATGGAIAIGLRVCYVGRAAEALPISGGIGV